MTEPSIPDRDPEGDAVRAALSEAEEGLSGEQPAVGDWAGLVRTRVVRRRTRQAVAGGLAAAAVFAAAGVVYALPGGGPESLVAEAPTGRPEPSASSSPSPTVNEPTAQPSPSPSGEPAAVPSPPVAVRIPPPPAPELPAGPQAPAPKAPAFPPAPNTVTLEITVTPERPVVGEEVTITVVARGNKAKPFLTQFTYDRGRRSEAYPIAACPPGEPEPVAPEPGSTSDSVTFTYTEAGPETITLRADSACSYYQGSNSANKDVRVAPAPEPTSSPAP